MGFRHLGNASWAIHTSPTHGNARVCKAWTGGRAPLAEGARWLSSRLGWQADGGLVGQLLQGWRLGLSLLGRHGQACLVLAGAARGTAGARALLCPLSPHAACVAECLGAQGPTSPHGCLVCATLLALLQSRRLREPAGRSCCLDTLTCNRSHHTASPWRHLGSDQAWQGHAEAGVRTEIPERVRVLHSL